MKKLNRIIDFPGYPFSIMLSFGQSDKELIRSLKPYNLGEDNMKEALRWSPTNRGRCVQFSTGQTLIRMPAIPKTPTQLGTLSHEIFHSVSFVLDRVGVKFMMDVSDEVYAHAIGEITQRVHEILKR